MMIRINFLRTAILWLISRFKQGSQQDIGDNISLETVNRKMRLVVWFFLLIHITAVTFFSETRLPTFFYVFVYAVWCGYLYLLLKGKNELIKGLPFIIVNLGAALALVLKGESYFLRLTTFSLPSLPIYSVQGFPPVLMLLLGAGYFLLHNNYLHYINAFYEPITQSYRIPEISLLNTLKGYRIGLFLEIFSLLVYQIVVQRLWRNYQKAKKNLEETNQKLQAVNLQLAKNVEELADLNKQLKNALHSQDLFVACVSHELRNPLNVMLGSLDLLEPHLKGSNEAQLLKTCRVCGDALLSQINNLLDVAKINADKLEINEFATNMAVFLEKFWAFTRIGLEKKRLQGCLAVDKNLSLWLNIDSYRLQQILNNLVGNAIKFTTAGSVRVTFRCNKGMELESWDATHIDGREGQERLDETTQGDDNPAEFNDMTEGSRQLTYFSQTSQKKNTTNSFMNFKLEQSIQDTLEDILPSSDESNDNFMKIEIVDTGCGIPEEAQQSVFEPFVQGDRSVTRRYGGTGLGLYIVKSLVNRMGGQIKVRSLKDVGTRFQIILPIKPVKRVHTSKKLTPNLLLSLTQSQSMSSFIIKNSDIDSPANQALNSAKKIKRVLIVDDDPFNQTLLKEYFKKFDYEADTASNGLEGFQLYQSNVHRYSFITMDIQMPIVDGITASKRIRAFEKETGLKRIPIVIVTGNCSEDERATCLDNDEIQASYFFRKPFRLSDCKLCLERISAEVSQLALEESRLPESKDFIPSKDKC